MINLVTVDNFATLFNCMPVDQASDSMMPDLKISVGLDRSSFVCCLVNGASTDDLLLLQIFIGDLQLSRNTLYLLSPRLYLFTVIIN